MESHIHGKASGQYSLATSSAEILSPVKIQLVVDGQSFVRWSMDCVKGSKVITTRGRSTKKSFGTIHIEVPKSATKCQLAANAENFGEGSIKVSIESAG